MESFLSQLDEVDQDNCIGNFMVENETRRRMIDGRSRYDKIVSSKIVELQ